MSHVNSQEPSTSSATERKVTRPTIISPNVRPVSFEVSATGLRKIPIPPLRNASEKEQKKIILEPTLRTALKNSETPVGKVLETPASNTSAPCSVGKAVERNILEEMGLILSDEDYEDSVTNKDIPVSTPVQTVSHTNTILISPQPLPSSTKPCSYKFLKGTKKGLACGRNATKGRNFCAVHSSGKNIVSQVEKNENTLKKELAETKKMLTNLEEIVRDLLKTKKTEPVAPSPKIKPAAKKLQNAPKPQTIEKRRIYKLDPCETYKLVGYKTGMPVFRCRNKLYKVPLPKNMTKKTPNNRWSLVCNPDYPIMEWKEI